MQMLFENTDPNLCRMLSEQLEQIDEIILSRMSSATVVESLKLGKLSGISKDMKLSQTKFFHGYLGEQGEQEIIVQVSAEKVAVFY